MPQTKYIAYVPPPKSIKLIGKIHGWLYRASGGLIGSSVDGLDILLLTTFGKQSGLPRCVPLPYFRDGARYLLLASFGGNPKNPAWLSNLIANPQVEVQLGRRRWRTRAQLAEGQERERLWGAITYDFPRYLAYQTKTSRVIPVVVIEPG